MAKKDPRDYVQALRRFKASDLYEKSSDPDTIGTSDKRREYLENRLDLAFESGYEAAEKANRDAT